MNDWGVEWLRTLEVLAGPPLLVAGADERWLPWRTLITTGPNLDPWRVS